MMAALIGFGDYPPAARIVSHVRRRIAAMVDQKDANAQRLAQNLDIRLNAATQKLLIADLKSGDPTRQRNAAQLLESLGHVALPFLIDTIKQEPDFRARQTAAALLTKQGVKAVNSLKRLLVLEIAALERVNVLEVIDSVTTDLITELFLCMGDEDLNVRMAAFRLAERLNDHRVVGMLLESAKTSKGQLAVAAVNTLEKLKPPEAVDALTDLLKTTKEEELRIACCRALGQIAKTECIEPLANALGHRSLILRRYRYSPQVRATAAFALGQIRHAHAIKTLAAFVKDPDQRIREVARAVIQKVRVTSRRKKVAVSMAK
jgi:HEAT repeat protein